LFFARVVESESVVCDSCGGRCWLQWNAATKCNIMLPLLTFPMHYYPAARCNPICHSMRSQSRFPDPAVLGVMATPVGTTRQ
jgi:hypothetical protein